MKTHVNAYEMACQPVRVQAGECKYLQYNKIWFQNCFFNSDFVFEMYEWYWYLKLWVLKSCKFYTKEIQSLPLSFFPNNIISYQSFDSARCKENAHDMRHMELNANSGINECHFHPTKSTILL